METQWVTSKFSYQIMAGKFNLVNLEVYFELLDMLSFNTPKQANATSWPGLKLKFKYWDKPVVSCIQHGK